MRLVLKVDQALLERLMAEATAERRPLAWQAEVLLRRSLGLPFPPEKQPERQEVAQWSA